MAFPVNPYKDEDPGDGIHIAQSAILNPGEVPVRLDNGQIGALDSSSLGGGGVDQQGWIGSITAETDMTETSSFVIYDWIGHTPASTFNSINEGATPDWFSVNEDFSPASLHLEPGTYLAYIDFVYNHTDTLNGATSVDGLTGQALSELARRAGGSTALTILEVEQNPAVWPGSDQAATVTGHNSYIISVPADTARQDLKLTLSVNVTDPTWFVHVTTNITITRIA